MTRRITATVCAVLAACSSNQPQEDDTFTQAATSWQCAPVADMIRVWGPPATQSDAVGSRPGLTNWRSYAVSGGIGTGGDRGRRCQISAFTDSAGIIERIEVNSSKATSTLATAWIRSSASTDFADTLQTAAAQSADIFC